MLNLEQTCNNPHHDAPPDRNRVQGYRRGLASLSVVKELLFRVYRNALIGRIAAMPNSVQDVSGGTYWFAFTCSGFVSTNPETRRELAFQLCLPQLPLSFCFVF
jgi:hypothetical protein